MNDNTEKYKSDEFEKYLLAGDYEKCYDFVKTVLNDGIDTSQLYDEILKKSLYTIGEMWETGKISVSAEHLASAIVETILSEEYFKISTKNKIQKTVVVACTENEFHQIGSKMVSDIFQLNGWNVHYLGANTTRSELNAVIGKAKPDILAISLSIPFNLPLFEKTLTTVRAEFSELYILAGGQAFIHGGLEVLERFDKIIYKPDIKALDNFLKTEIADKS